MIIIYEGPSAIDGKPIVAVATFGTKNEKTGPMIQTWILRSDVSPVEAINTGDDSSICGSCPLRGILEDGVNRGRSCYVSIQNAPRAIYGAYTRGRYRKYTSADRHLFRGKLLRLGSYGDPVAVPLPVWIPFLRMSSNHTGYTHQWRDCSPAWSKYAMASVETVEDMREAQQSGWRTFRTRLEGSPVEAGEIVCPASDEAGKARQCATCLACNGSNGNPSRRSIAIVGHGGKAVLSNFVKLQNRVLNLS